MKLNKLMFAAMATFALVVQPVYAVVTAQTASAASGDTIVSPDNMNGWYTTANSGGAATFVLASSPLGHGALQLSTVNSNSSDVRAAKTSGVNIPVASLTELSYDAKVLSTLAPASVNASFRLGIDLDNNGTEDKPLVYETYYNLTYVNAASANATNTSDWQTWDVKNGKFWGAWNGGGGYDTNQTLAEATAGYPDAKIVRMSLGLGSYNPTSQVLVDNVRVNGQSVDFEATIVATNVTTGAVYGALQDAIDAATAGNVIRLERNIVLTDDVDITKPLTIDGNGKTITANFIKSGNDNNSALSVLANDVTIKNVTLDGVAPVTNQLHGINAYQVTNLLVDGVTTKNFRTGILYNGSTGTIQNVHTINNAWHGINIDKAGSNVNVLGTNTHTEPFNIYVDNDTVGVTVNAPAYEWSRSGLEGRDNDRVYRKKVVVTPVTPVTPTNPTTPQDGGDNGEVPVSGGGGAASSSSDSDVAVAESTTSTNESKDAEVLGTDESDVDTSSAQDTKEEKHWSLVNVLLAGVAVVMSIITLAGIRGSEGRAKWLRILTIIPAVGAIIAVLTVEDFTASLGWMNGWTLLFMVIVIAQAVLRANVKPAEQ